MDSASISRHAVDNDWGAVRREFHRFPELSGRERETSKRVANYLESFLPDKMIRGIGGTGLLALFEGSEPGPTSWFRAELDALPIQETERPHASKRPGVAHLCGHDGHLTILLRLAELLDMRRPVRGNVGLLFQPAEETGAGAARLIKSSKLRKLLPDRIFALHNLPGFPAGQIILRPETFTASVISLAIHLNGHTAHAAEPGQASKAGELIHRLWSLANKLTRDEASNEDYAIVTPVHYRLGTLDYGITPGSGEIHFTIRAYSEEKMHLLLDRITKTALRKGSELGLKVDTFTLEHFPAVVNDPELTHEVRQTAIDSGYDFLDKPEPFPWGEDFSHFTGQVPGVMIGWGAGTGVAPLHHPEYDFPDMEINRAARFFHQLCHKYHGSDNV